MVKVSIVVPIFNVENYLPRFFSAIENLTLKDFEVLLIDDGSTDNSLKLCKNFQKKDPRVLVFHQENKGAGVARNKGLQNAKGKYIYFSDPDDYFKPNLLSENYEIAEKFSAEMVVFGYTMVTTRGKNLKTTNYPVDEFLKNKSDFIAKFPELYLDNLLYFLWNKLYLRSAIEKIRFETVRTGQDTRFNYKVFQNIRRVYLNSSSYYYYQIGRKDSAQNQVRIDKAISSFDELNQLKHLYYEVWQQKPNPEFSKLLRREYLGIVWFTIFVGCNISDKKEREKTIDLVLKREEIRQYLKINKSNSFKTNLKLILLRFRKNNFIWYVFRKNRK